MLGQWKELVELDYEHQVYWTAVRHRRGCFCDQYLYEKEVKMCCANIQHRPWLEVIHMNPNYLDADDQARSSKNFANFSSPFSPCADYCRFQCTVLSAAQTPTHLKQGTDMD